MSFDEVKAFIEFECKKYGVHFILSEKNVVSVGALVSNGFFSDGFIDDDGNEVHEPILALGTNKNSLEVLIHEYCHMQQYLEDKEAFSKLTEYSFFWEWIDGEHSDIADEIIDLAVSLYYSTELDCEKRAVELHKEWNTGVNISEYIQKANAYTLYYLYMRENRVWYKPGKEPYVLEEIWRKMPTTFDFDRVECYSSMHNLFELCSRD